MAGSGFSSTPNTGEFRRHSSWGRTRSPKSLTGVQGGAVALLAATGSLEGTSASTVGYATENQRYLHVLVEDANDSTNLDVDIYGYCHAFTRWFAIPQGFDPTGTNADPTAAKITVADSTLAPAAQGPTRRDYRVYHIVGIDRVAFVGDDDDINVFAACSTF